MEPLDSWRLCDELSVIQAALLIIGADPSESQEYIDGWEAHKRPVGYDAAKAALTNAIEAGRLPVLFKRAYQNALGEDVPDWHRTTIEVPELRQWLIRRGVKTGFFFPEGGDTPKYLEPSHGHYSQKLAAAIRAWEAVSSDSDLIVGKTVKQALAVWLRKHANDFGLTKEDGRPNEQGIEEIAKIANWDTKGGAPKTPSGR